MTDLMRVCLLVVAIASIVSCQRLTSINKNIATIGNACITEYRESRSDE